MTIMTKIDIAMLIISGFAFVASYIVHKRNKRMDAEWAKLEKQDQIRH